MKILYIFTSPSPKDGSVQTKVKTQIESLNQDGVICKGAFIGTFEEKDIVLNSNIKYYKIAKSNWKYFRLIGQQKNLNNAVFELIKNNYEDYDVFYIRYYGASKFFYKVSKHFGRKIVTEHQSLEIKEIISLKEQNPFSFNPSRFLSWIQYFLYPIIMEKFYGTLTAKNLLAAVCVTNEIALYKKKIGFNNTISLPNGIGVQQYKVRKSPSFDSKLKLIFLKGTHTMAPWNGFERIVNSIDEFNKNKTNQCEIELIVCGHKFEGEIPNREYIKHLGYLTKIELDKLMDEVHIGVSTMESYKEGIYEASRLKAREYVARGLPFIYANEDLDFNNETDYFALKLPNSSELIDFNKVIDFATNVLLDSEHPQKMRKYAEEHLDFQVKMKKLYQELQKL
jgi:hypothetical protein